MDETSKRRLDEYTLAGREFRAGHSKNTLRDVRHEARSRYADELDQLAFQTGWLLADSALHHEEFLKGKANFESHLPPA
jgi:hypothetical protein